MRDYLKKIREEQGKTQQHVAFATGLTRQYYNMIESGERQADMSLSIMKKLSEAFEVPLDYIIEQESKLNQAG